MSLDGALLHCVKSELESLIGARVDKIYQPSRDEIVITVCGIFRARIKAASRCFSRRTARRRGFISHQRSL